uniref:ISXO2-like transposase domain-containing protein n=1 Tax=Clastoptera arizonana TaxID=38151 RepID=A0A1B6DPS7_9HEMI
MPMTFWTHSRFSGTNPTTIFMVYEICENKYEFLKFLQEKGLISSRYKCPSCGKKMFLVDDYKISDGFEWKCSSFDKQGKHSCRRSIRKGSWFEHSSHSLQDIILMSYFWYREYPHRIVQYEMQTGNNKIVLDWFNFCKGVCVDIVMHKSRPIGGKCIKIELYESKFWKRTNVTGQKVQNQWIFCGLERNTTHCFLVAVNDKSSKTILKIVEKYIMPGTIIYSDVWKDTSFDQELYKHLTIDHKLIFQDMECEGNVNITEGIWTMIKRQFPESKRSKSLFDGFIGEFMYRRMLSDIQDGFLQFLDDISKVYQPHTSDIVL